MSCRTSLAALLARIRLIESRVGARIYCTSGLRTSIAWLALLTITSVSVNSYDGEILPTAEL